MRSHYARLFSVTPASPESLGTMFAWYRADSGITLNSGNVSSWADLLTGRTFTQTTGANQPPFQSTDSNLNNRPSVLFNNATQVLISTDTAHTWKFLSDGSGMSIVFVGWQAASAANGGVLGCMVNGNDTGVSMSFGTSGLGYNVGKGATPKVIGTSYPTVAAAAWSAMTLTTVQFTKQASGNARTTAAAATYGNTLNTTGDPSYTLRFGRDGSLNGSGGVAFTGSVAEICIYSSELSAGALTKFAQYAHNKYGVGL